MNTLTFERRTYDARIADDQPVRPYAQSEFVVDGVGLSERFGFEEARPFFGQTCFEWSAEHLGARALELRGLASARSQLGEGRFVLYGCHCGSDYCGVISCAITREGGDVIWSDVRHEDADWSDGEDELEEDDGVDGEDGAMFALRLSELRFDAASYDDEVARHVKVALAAAAASEGEVEDG